MIRRIIHFILERLSWLPFLLAFVYYKKNSSSLLKDDLHQWKKVFRFPEDISDSKLFFLLMKRFPEYRSLLYYRLRKMKGIYLLKLLAKPIPNLYFNTDNIAGGLVMQHGYSTVIFATSIGRNCQIWQNVTIGRSITGGPCPIIGDNVKIYTGSIVVGGITIGDNVVIGAGSLVRKSVPSNCVIAGNPALIIKKNGIPVKELL